MPVVFIFLLLFFLLSPVSQPPIEKITPSIMSKIPICKMQTTDGWMFSAASGTSCEFKNTTGKNLVITGIEIKK